MTTNQEDLAHAAKHLRVLYDELNQAKYDRPPAPEASTHAQQPPERANGPGTHLDPQRRCFLHRAAKPDGV